MKSVQVHNLDDAQLVEFVAGSREELFNLRFQHATGQLENTARLAQAKRDLARGLTVVRERGLDLESEIRRYAENG